MASNVSAISRRKFTDMNFLMVSVWSAFVLVFSLMPKHNQFMLWVLAGGGGLIASHLYSVVYRGKASQGYLQLAAITPVFLTVSTAVMMSMASMTPNTYDAFLLKWDFGISAAVRNWSSGPMLMRFMDLVYDALPLFMVSAILVSKGRNKTMLMVATVVSSLICPFLSYLVPAVGPAHVGDPLAPRNCVPSMHFTWTLLLWVYSEENWKWVFGAIAFLTAWSTLATGEHYTLDLVGAVLYTWGIVVLTKVITRSTAKRLASLKRPLPGAVIPFVPLPTTTYGCGKELKERVVRN